MDLETIFHLQHHFPPIAESLLDQSVSELNRQAYMRRCCRTWRIWTRNRVYNSSSYYSMVRHFSGRHFSDIFQVDGQIKIHSLSPKIKSTLRHISSHKDAMLLKGDFWNIENASILFSIKSGFVFF